jgi:hypothetical protein
MVLFAKSALTRAILAQKRNFSFMIRELPKTPNQVLGIFPEAVRNSTIFRFPAKNDRMTKRKYPIYIYRFVAYFMLILKINIFYWLGLTIV